VWRPSWPLLILSKGNATDVSPTGEYTPPSCEFNRITFNFTVTSAGRQFDRLGLMYFNDTEVFRTSTAEPTATGIEWTYVKDMSNYLVLFKEPQKIIFDLGNLIDSTYTASFNTTLTATFFVEDETTAPADVILPISTRQSALDSPSAFMVPSQNATSTLTLPQNVKKAVFSIAACGQSTEEFWWSNVLSSDTKTFPNVTALYGYSPFRELQLYIDGMLAGVAWPFPVIFTGGVVPGFWRPIVGLDAFDLREDEIDISAFLPLLCDGKEHTFEIRVVGINDDGSGHGTLTHTVGSYWVVTGKVFLWLDSSGWVTTGSDPVQVVPPPTLHMSSSVGAIANGTNTTLAYSVQVQRRLSFTSTIQTSQGPHIASWQQTLSYSNYGNFTDEGNAQVTNQKTNGIDVSSNGYSKVYGYPLYVYSLYATEAGGNYTIAGAMDRSKNVQMVGQLAFPSELQSFGIGGWTKANLASFSGTSSNNRQNGSATYLAAPSQTKSYSWGSTEQDLSFAGIQASLFAIQTGAPPVQGSSELYHRHVLATNGTVIEDEHTLVGKTFQNHYPAIFADKQSFARSDIKAMLGRGPP
jgi:Peptide N-acetyl-beta-D-glucosaminyl asparaginase amidase A